MPQKKNNAMPQAVSAAAKGRRGEDEACRYLEDNGIFVIARNYRSRETGGEVDIIAIDHGAVVFVEVKRYHSYSIESMEQALNKKKRQKIIETAKHFLSKTRKYKCMAVRFDIIFAGGERFIHIADAFMETT
jgi:putative endonuclease